MNNNDDIKLTQLYNELDLYLGASVTGEKVEIIITPKEEDGKYNNDKRVVTIGLQNGFSRERVHFAIEDGKKFDDVVLPEILKYLAVDKNSDWDISTPTTKDSTVKAIVETEPGTVIYLETFDNDLVYRLKNTVVPDKSSLQQEYLEWQTIINYVKERLVTEDFFQKVLTDSERKKLEKFVYDFCENKAFSFKTKAKKETVMKNLYLALESETYKEELKNNGIDESTHSAIHTSFDKETLEKMKNKQIIEQLATTIQATKKVNDFLKKNNDKLTTSIEDFNSKITFTINELLGKTKYFQKRNASYKAILEHEQDKKYGDNCFGAVEELKQGYQESSSVTLSEEQKNMYIAYCNQLQGFLKTKAKQSKKDSSSISFSQIDKIDINNIDNLDELVSKIKLFKNARINDEKFEAVIIKHPNDKAKRLVRIALTSGTSRNDEYNFLFTDGDKFDKNDLNFIIDELIYGDKIKESVNGGENLSRTLLTTEEENEILIDNEIYSNNKIKYKLKNNKILENNVNNSNSEKIETNDEYIENIKKSKEKSVMLSKDDEELTEYFSIELLRNRGQLPPAGLNRIQEIAKSNERVSALEEARKRLNNGALSKEEYNRIHDTYRAHLAESVKDKFEKTKDNDNLSNRLDTIEKALYDYIIKKEKNPVSDEKANNSIIPNNQEDKNIFEEIKDAYEVAEQYSSIEKPASFRIHFPKETPGFSKVIISLGTSNEEVLLEKVISKEELMSEIDGLCQCFISNSSAIEEIHQQVPNTLLGLLIVTGRNGNAFQVSNAENKDIEVIKESMKKANESIKNNNVELDGRHR